MVLHEAREGWEVGSTQLAGPAEMLSIDNNCWSASLLSNLKHMGDLMINASTWGSSKDLKVRSLRNSQGLAVSPLEEDSELT